MVRCWRSGCAVLVFVVATLSGVSLPAQTKHVPTFDEQLSLKRVGGARISPDGRFVVYGLTETNWKDNEYMTHLWVADLRSGRTFQLTRGRKSSGRVEWSPDSRWIAFVTEREPDPTTEADRPKKESQPTAGVVAASAKTEPAASEEKPEKGKPAASQIWVISPEGGEAWQFTKAEGEIGEFHWSKDSRRIAFIGNPPTPKTTKDRKEKYADFEVFEKEFNEKQLFVADVQQALDKNAPVDATQVTRNPELNVDSFAWAPDSGSLVFSARRVPLLAFSADEDVYLVDFKADNAVQKLVALPGPDGSPHFSPDGKRIAFVASFHEKSYYYLNRHIAVIDLEAALAHPVDNVAQVNDVTKDFDEDADLIDWGPDGIYFAAQQKTASYVYRADPRTHAVTRVTPREGADIFSASFSADFRTMAFLMADAQSATEVYVSPVSSSFAPRRLTAMNEQLKDFVLGAPEVIQWKSADGVTIEGILLKPADYDPHRKYPLLVTIHGGPTGTSMPTLSAIDSVYPIQAFLARGALVLAPNYRGSAGYGEKFRSLNVRNLGVGDMMDVMSGVDALIAKGIVDPGRLAAMGWSQGGYISAFLTTHTDRFKAISVGAGISNWTTYYVSTDITPFTREYLQATPWDDPEIYAKTSPMTTIRQAKTPTLIQQGSNDKRVPVPDSFELYRGLQDQGVPSRLILYTGFGHGINKPRSNRALLQANWDWFGHYLWNDSIPQNSALLGVSELEGTAKKPMAAFRAK